MAYPGHSHSPSVPSLPTAGMDPLQHGFAALSLGGNQGYGHMQHVPPPTGHRRRGACKFFNSQKGFGFVNDDHAEELGGQEVFVHYTAISGKGGFRSLAEGEEVEYEIVQGPKGYQASNLTGPGGRNVMGDPKARLPKPHQFMSLSPMHPLVQANLLSLYANSHDASFNPQAVNPYASPYGFNVPVPSLHSHSHSMSQMPYQSNSPTSRNLMPYQSGSTANGLANMAPSVPSASNGYNVYAPQNARSPYQSGAGMVGLPSNPMLGQGQQPVFGQSTMPGSGPGQVNQLFNGVNRGAVGDGSPSRNGAPRYGGRMSPSQNGVGVNGAPSNGGVPGPVPAVVAGSHVRTDSANASLERPASKNEGGVNGSGHGSGNVTGAGTPNSLLGF